MLQNANDLRYSLERLLLAILSVSISYRFEVRVVHGVLWSDSFGMVVSEHLAQQVQSLI